MGTGQFERAETQFRKLLEQEPGNSAAWHGLGLAHLNMDKASEAKRALQQAVMIEPNEAGFFYDLGNVCMDLGDWSDAEAAFQRSLTLNPSFPMRPPIWGRFSLNWVRLIWLNKSLSQVLN